MELHGHDMSVKILSGVLFVIACVALYAGAVMLLFVPGYPGESYFAPQRMLYGVPPTLLWHSIACCGRVALDSFRKYHQFPQGDCKFAPVGCGDTYTLGNYGGDYWRHPARELVDPTPFTGKKLDVKSSAGTQGAGVPRTR